MLETLAATAITAGMAAAAFQLFHQNERLFRDQSVILEMQQSARAIVSQFADDIRRAGQGVPPGMDDVILPGTSDSRLNLRASYSGTESTVASSLPLVFTIGTPFTISVDSTSGFSSGRQAFLWTDLAWIRATIDSVSGSTHSVRVTPTVAAVTPAEFVVPPTLSLDEAVSLFFDATTKTIRRTTASNTENAESPAWAPANELAANVTDLDLDYLDADSMPITPDTPGRRQRVRAIEVRVSVRAATTLSDGSRPVYRLSTRAVPRNLALR